MAFLTASSRTEFLYALTLLAPSPAPTVHVQLRMNDTACVEDRSMGPWNVLESETEPSGAISLQRMHTDCGRTPASCFPRSISDAIVGRPRLNTPARERNVGSSHPEHSSALDGNLSQYDALAALTAPGSSDLTSSPFTTLPVQSSYTPGESMAPHRVPGLISFRLINPARTAAVLAEGAVNG